MTGLLEARDLVSGSVSAAPACLQLAPDPASISDLLHDDLPRDEAELQRAKGIYAEFAQALLARGGWRLGAH